MILKIFQSDAGLNDPVLPVHPEVPAGKDLKALAIFQWEAMRNTGVWFRGRKPKGERSLTMVVPVMPQRGQRHMGGQGQFM